MEEHSGDILSGYRILNISFDVFFRTYTLGYPSEEPVSTCEWNTLGGYEEGTKRGCECYHVEIMEKFQNTTINKQIVL